MPAISMFYGLIISTVFPSKVRLGNGFIVARQMPECWAQRDAPVLYMARSRVQRGNAYSGVPAPHS
jgi:hypothetical protein